MVFNFGTTATTTPSFSFGNTTAPSGIQGFGSPATGTGLQFNSPSTAQQNTGLTFGTPGSLSFGTPTTNSATVKPFTGGLNFGATPQTTASTTTIPLGFGTPTQPAAATTTSGLTFGTTPSFGATKPTLSFGAPTTTTTAAPAAPSTGLFNFAAPKTTATTGFTLTTSTSGTGLFGTATTQITTAPTSAAAPFKGLGGVDISQSSSTGTDSQPDGKPSKENQVPHEIMQTIDGFKTFVKQQKNLACEVSRASEKPVKKVMEDCESLKQLLLSIGGVQQKNRVLANKLKIDTSKCLVQCEMAQRTHNTPMGLQNDNMAPVEFFINLASKFEKDAHNLRQQIDNTEKHVKSLSQPVTLSPQELSVALKHLHDSFVALAGRLQTAHSQVQAMKEKHLSLSRHFLKDNTNVFESPRRREAAQPRIAFPTNISPGPSPFSSIGNAQTMSLRSFQENSITPFQTGGPLAGWSASPSTNIMSGSQSNFLQSPGTLTASTVTDNQNFQLLKPPVGNKRGKR